MCIRDSYDAQGSAAFHGTGRKGTNTVDDYRHSRDFLPDKAQLVYRVAGADGGERLIEVAVVLTHCCQIAREKDLSDIPEVGKDTTLEAGCHFGTFAKRDGTFPPFPCGRGVTPSVQGSSDLQLQYRSTFFVVSLPANTT